LRHLAPLVRAGTTTGALDAAAHAFIIAHNAYPSPLGYNGFPASITTSVNHCVCHGIPGPCALRDGDILNVDVTVFLNGHHGDTSAMFEVGCVAPAARQLVETARLARDSAVALCGPGVSFSRIGEAVESVAEAHGMKVVGSCAGHGVGSAFHAAPTVLHCRNSLPGVMQVGAPTLQPNPLNAGSSSSPSTGPRPTSAEVEAGMQLPCSALAPPCSSCGRAAPPAVPVVTRAPTRPVGNGPPASVFSWGVRRLASWGQ
jgi:methionyl aminopeptidase